MSWVGLATAACTSVCGQSELIRVVAAEFATVRAAFAADVKLTHLDQDNPQNAIDDDRNTEQTTEKKETKTAERKSGSTHSYSECTAI